MHEPLANNKRESVKLEQQRIGSGSVSGFCELAIADLLHERLQPHPFSSGITKENVEPLLRNYFAMSQAFPFIQASAHGKLFKDCIRIYGDVPAQLECGFVVGSFLVWDEVGGHYCVQKGGVKALPAILQTGEQFHSNLLRKDVAGLLGKEVSPFYSDVTKRYLSNLTLGLESRDHVERCATMVAFERHAQEMIESLWNSLVALYNCKKDNLIYFKAHVGGDDPAEAYHVDMTKRMIDKMVPRDAVAQFMVQFEKMYGENVRWCEDIKGEKATIF